MTTELETRWTLNPVTGERYELDASPRDLATWLADLRQMKREIDGAVGRLTDEVLARMDKDAHWKLQAENYELTSTPPGDEYDVEKLMAELNTLVDTGVIGEAAAKAAVETKVTHEVRKRGITALRKLGAAVNEALDRCQKEPTRRRYVSVKVSE